MTAHRTLKRLVRNRMERTNESYTTAHRQVTARAADPAPPGLTPGYPAFGAVAHGPSGQVSHLLAQSGSEISEPMACGLGGGIGFLYAVFEYAEVPHPLLTIVAQHHPQPWLEAVAQHLGLELRAVTSSKATAALAKLDALLDSGTAAHLTVARGHLPWHPPGRPEEAADPHSIVVAGRVGDEYLIDDGNAAPHRLSAEVLGAAWAAHRQGRFRVTTLDRPVSQVDLGAGIRAAVRTTHAHLTGPVIGHAYDVNFGLSGLRRLADDLADSRSRRGWARRFSGPEAFPIGSRRLAECLTWAHTAAGATRPLYAEFLTEAGPIAGLDLELAAATAAESGRRWAELADLAGAVTNDDDPLATIAMFAELAAGIVPVEEQLAEQLAAALER